jgi:hypothetical protein
MEQVLENPLEMFGDVLEEALADTYIGIRVSNRPPSLEEIAEYFPPHFYQLLYLRIIIDDHYDHMGVKDELELREKIITGLYDRFIPNLQALEMYLKAMQLSYFDRDFYLLNNAVVEVW